MTPGAVALARGSMSLHGKSFALAARLFPQDLHDDAALVYAWCRRADDTIDLAPPERQPALAEALVHELRGLYDGEAQRDPVLAAFQSLVARRGIPREYPEELLAGMADDARGPRIDDDAALLQYCFRVASTVGLMMCHVMGVRDAAALENAAHLGMAMQLTNICRDVSEDWSRGRLYLPGDRLARAGASDPRRGLGGEFPADLRAPAARVTLELLDLADGLYASGDRGIPALSLRAGVAVRAARLVYSDIGRVLRARGGDPLGPRAVVGTARRLWLVARAVGSSLGELGRGFAPAPLSSTLSFADVLPR